MRFGTIRRGVLVVALVLAAFCVQWNRELAPRAQVSGVGTGSCHTWDPATGTYYMAPCDFGDDDADDGTDSGYGGGGYGGCAATVDDSAYAPVPTPEAPPPHVYASGGYWHPEPGYCFRNYDDATDLSVVPAGSAVPGHPNVVYTADCHRVPASGFVWANSADPAAGGYAVRPEHLMDTGGGIYRPEPGYCFANLDDARDVGVVPVGASPYGLANVVFNADCALIPAAGYRWSNPADPIASGYAVDLKPLAGSPVPGHAGLIYGEGGRHVPAPGYDWADGYGGGTAVIVAISGAPVPYLDNVIYAADANLLPAPDYVWANAADPRDLRVERVRSPDPARDPAVRTRLAVIDVPSPTGYRDPRDREMQIAMLSDRQIDTEIERMRRTLEAMQKDFQGDAGTLEEWLAIAQDAEMEAVLDSLDLLGGGLIKWAGAKGSRAAPFGELAQQGIKASTYLARARTLRAGDPAGAETEMKLAREILVDAYDKLHPFDPELASKAGGTATELVSFAVNYSYEMARWALAYEQTRLISASLGRAGGKLEAQKSIQRLYEDLIRERNRRRV